MTWSKHAEVTTVHGGELRLVESLDDGQHCRVHEAYIGVCVTIAQLTNPAVVGGQEILDQVGSFGDIVEQRDENAGAEPLAGPIVDLDEYGRRYDKWLGRILDEAAA